MDEREPHDRRLRLRVTRWRGQARKVAGADVGLSARFMGTHSLRRGGSNAINAVGFGDNFRKTFCAWLSDCHKIYKDPQPLACVGVARRMWEAKDTSGGLRL